MAQTVGTEPRHETPHRSPWMAWLLEGETKGFAGPGARESKEHVHPWYNVMCLTGVDYFSTLGYQPGIAALAAGALSPMATLILVLLTLGGALPIYRRVAQESPRGEGSIAMLEHLLGWWQGKLFVLALLGFVATDFIITITLSAADATSHIIENPFAPHFLQSHRVLIALALVALLGSVFLKGFKEAMGLAVVLVIAYLALNTVVVGYGLYRVFTHPHVFGEWKTRLFHEHGSIWGMIGVSMLLFPKLALGLSGFETGVTVMPLVKGDDDDNEDEPKGRIRNTRKLLVTAALIMSVFLLSSSLVTTLLIPPKEFVAASGDHPAGKANGRALAYLAHQELGEAFGTVYDVSTILILWFAGASAMAGLVNIVPRYLPRFGMAPEWTRAARPLVLIYSAVAFAVTIIFRADVDAQGGAYATGVLVLISSAAVAVMLSCWKRGAKGSAAAFAVISLVFAYTTVVNVWERPDGVKIASLFIAAIVVFSFGSRLYRSTELRVDCVKLDDTAKRFIDEAAQGGDLHLIANNPDRRGDGDYDLKEKQVREDYLVPPESRLLILEIYLDDPSDFSETLHVQGVDIDGHYVLRGTATAVPNAIAAFLLFLRDQTGQRPHAYFNWTEGNPLHYLLRYVLSGRGDVAPITREVLRQAEPDPQRRPAVHAGT